MRGLEIRKRVCFSPSLYYTTYKCKHILLKASSHFDLSLLQKKKKKEEAILELDMEKQTGSKSGKGTSTFYILSLLISLI